MTLPINSDTLAKLLSMNSLQNQPLTGTTENDDVADEFSILLENLLQDLTTNTQSNQSLAAASPLSSSSAQSNETNALWGLLSAQAPAANSISSASKSTGAKSLAGSAESALLSGSGYSDIIRQMADKYGVDPALIQSVMETESGGNATAVSSAGAQGLMQLMPATARSLGVANTFDPAENIEGGTKYLKELLQEFGGNTRLAVAAYNAGSASVKKYGGVPPYPETQSYVAKVIGKMDGKGTV